MYIASDVQFSLHLQMGASQKAFEYLGSALTFDPTNTKVCAYL